MNFVSKATSPQSSVFAQACLVLSCHSPLTWLLRTLLWEGSEGVGWLGTSLGVGGNWQGIARRVGWVWEVMLRCVRRRLCVFCWKGFWEGERKGWVSYEKDLFHKIRFQKNPPHCRIAKIKWREEVWCGITGHDYNPASGLTCSVDTYTSLVFFFLFLNSKVRFFYFFPAAQGCCEG